MGKKNSYNGSKLRGEHHDYTDAAAPLVKEAIKDPSVVGIHFGRIENHSRGRGVTFTQEGKDRLIATIGSASSSQVITFHTTNRQRVQAALEKAFR